MYQNLQKPIPRNQENIGQLVCSRLANVAYYTDKCPVEFWIWPVDDSKNKLLEVCFFFMVFECTCTYCTVCTISCEISIKFWLWFVSSVKSCSYFLYSALFFLYIALFFLYIALFYLYVALFFWYIALFFFNSFLQLACGFLFVF